MAAVKRPARAAPKIRYRLIMHSTRAAPPPAPSQGPYRGPAPIHHAGDAAGAHAGGEAIIGHAGMKQLVERECPRRGALAVGELEKTRELGAIGRRTVRPGIVAEEGHRIVEIGAHEGEAGHALILQDAI